MSGMAPLKTIKYLFSCSCDLASMQNPGFQFINSNENEKYLMVPSSK